MNTPRRQSAFTVIELLVAISVTVLLMTMVFQLFQNTQRAVTSGIQSGEMMVESETIGNQIRRDTDAMLSPSDDDDDAGFLVIVQRGLVAEPNPDGEGFRIRVRGREIPEYDPVEPDDPITVRSDQLIFVREHAANRDAIHALTPESTDTLASSVTARHARVWYGHAIRTDPDGTLDSDATLEDDGRPFNYANNWVLARQALLLTDDPGDIHAESARWDADIVTSPYGPFDPAQLFHGLTDVADQELENDDTENLGVVNEIDDADYPGAALPFTVPSSRPWVNPDPDSSYFEPWRVAQMHTYLSGKVSDIIIDFAGDYDDDATGNTQDGSINRDDDGNIIWYSQWYNNEDQERYDPDDPGAGYEESLPVTWDAGSLGFEEGGETGDTNEAYYISRDDIENDPDYEQYQDIADAIFVFRHDDYSSDTKWPYLIRIRYRMHDPRGYVGSETEDGQRIYGRWFEHVIRVQRPD